MYLIWLVFISWWWLVGGCSATSHTTLVNEAQTIFTQMHRPCEPLAQLLRQHHISPQQSLPDLIAATQASWLRRRGAERWEVDSSSSERLRTSFESLGLVHACLPTQRRYDYVLLLGATVTGMQQRLTYLVDLFHQGHHFDRWVVLTGQRPLSQHPVDRLPSLGYHSEPIDHELQAIEYLIKWWPLPKALRDLPLEVIDGPKQPGGTRPTTATTVKAWLATLPTPGSVLAISSQPHVGGASMILKTLLPASFQVEVVGPAADPKTSDAVFLDSLARWMYQYRIYHNKNHEAM